LENLAEYGFGHVDNGTPGFTTITPEDSLESAARPVTYKDEIEADEVEEQLEELGDSNRSFRPVEDQRWMMTAPLPEVHGQGWT